LCRPGNSNRGSIIAPIKGHHAIEFMGPSTVETLYSVEQFYDAMIGKMMGDLQVIRVDWCRVELWPPSVRPTGSIAVPALS
jgi:hypothetical protein